MNRVQGARRAPWTRFMNAPATAFGVHSCQRVSSNQMKEWKFVIEVPGMPE